LVTRNDVVYLDSYYSYLAARALDLSAGSIDESAAAGSLKRLHQPGRALRPVRRLNGLLLCLETGNTFGVRAATVPFDRRQTLHSVRLVDVANPLDPTLQSSLAQYSSLIVRNGGAGSDPALGAVQIFQSNFITQSRLLTYIDIYFGLAVLSLAVLCLILLARPATASVSVHPIFPEP
jgi:hypothetical protein